MAMDKVHCMIVVVVTLGLFVLTGLTFSTVHSAEAAFCLGYCPEASGNTGSTAISIDSNTNWHASIMESDISMASYSGSGAQTIPIDCSHGLGIYSAVVQKESAGGYATVSMIKDGSALKQKSTVAEYGLVSISGRCS